ncbi:MAG: 50S ribosomal protein L6 [Pseudomonadota bacterium]
MGISRIGKQPVAIPKGIKITLTDDKVVMTNGQATLEQDYDFVKVKFEDDMLILAPKDGSINAKARHGLYRSLFSNMVEGLDKGYMRRLEIHGIGYKVEMEGLAVKLTVGFSHPVVFSAPEGVVLSVPNATTVEMRSVDKQLVGETAAKLRRIRPPEPYKGKGIRYSTENVKKKVAKGK